MHHPQGILFPLRAVRQALAGWTKLKISNARRQIHHRLLRLLPLPQHHHAIILQRKYINRAHLATGRQVPAIPTHINRSRREVALVPDLAQTFLHPEVPLVNFGLIANRKHVQGIGREGSLGARPVHLE